MMEDRTLLSSFLVSNTADSGPGSFRQAILDSNGVTGAANTIDFDIPGAGVHTIEPLSALPAITSPVLIDGSSQPDYAGRPLIELNGSQLVNGGDGLLITAADVTVSGLDINDFSQGAGVHLTGTGAHGDWIHGDFLGTDPTGTIARPDEYGVEIDAGATTNLVGTNGDGVNDAAEMNLISGNTFAGIWIDGPGTSRNVVAGNLIGTTITGDVALDNGTYPIYDSAYQYYGGYVGGGIVIEGGASSNRVGTNGASVDNAGERNIIGGSGNDGIDIVGTGTSGNIVACNFIGTDLTGTVSLGIPGNGVFILGASGNWIGVNPLGGRSVADEGNLISGVGNDGVKIEDASSNVVAGDKIGTDVSGVVALGNGFNGVECYGGSHNTIGGTSAGAGDVISGNVGSGVQLDDGADNNLVAADEIGTDATGSVSLPNQEDGVDIVFSSTDNTIGGTTARAGNLITNNGGPGVVVGMDAISDPSTGNQITANRIFANTGQAIDLGNDGVTYNGAAPREGPNNLQNFPILYTAASGQLEGWLTGSLPNRLFRIDIFASAAFGPGGSGEAEDYLGTLKVTTNSGGQAFFAVPFTPPAGLPIITATATDYQGNTSEVSAIRRATLQAPSGSILAIPNQPLVFTTTEGDGIAIADPDAGPLDPDWSLTLSVSNGTLDLSTTAGLTGSGDGSALLLYSGPLSAVDAALDGLTYTPPAGPQVVATMTLSAQSSDAPTLETQIPISSGFFVVDTTADSGPGSLRQAILDADSAPGLAATIDFAIPGAGVQKIEPVTPLPAFTSPVSIDGASQPGYTGTPLVALGGPSGYLTSSGGNVSVTGLTVNRIVIDVSSDERLLAVQDLKGLSSALTLLDSQSETLVHSDGVSTASPESVVDEYLKAGTYSLLISAAAGAESLSLSLTLTPAFNSVEPPPFAYQTSGALLVAGDFSGNGIEDIATPNGVYLGLGDGAFASSPISLGLPDVIANYNDMVAADFTGNGILDLALTDDFTDTVVILLGNGNGTFQPPLSFGAGPDPVSLVAGDFNDDGKLDLAVADDGGFSPISGTRTGGCISLLLGNGDGTFQPATTIAAESDPNSLVAGDFTGDGNLDLAVADEGVLNYLTLSSSGGGVSVLLGNGDGTFQPPRQYAVGYTVGSITEGDFTGDGRTDLAFTGVNNDDDVSGVCVLLGVGDGTFQPPTIYAAGTSAGFVLAGDFSGEGKLDLAFVGGSNDNELLLLDGDGDGTFEPPKLISPLAIAGELPLAAADFNGDGRLDLAIDAAVPQGFEILLGNGDGSFESSAQSQSTEVTPPSTTTADFNGDGTLDVATVNSATGEVSVLLGNGDGTFQTVDTFPGGLSPDGTHEYAPVVAGDFNGDGRADLAVGVSDGVAILLGDGDATFQPATTYNVGFDPTDIVAGVFSHNGFFDLSVIGSKTDADGESSGELAILMGNGDGTFQRAVDYPLGSSVEPTQIVTGDFTGTGPLDLAVLCNNRLLTVAVFLGNGDGTFQSPVNYNYFAGSPLNFENSDSIAVGDFTGNGVLDLVVSADYDAPFRGGGIAMNTFTILMGNGDGTFQPAQTLVMPPDVNLQNSPGPTAAGDFNGDGRDQLVFDDVDSGAVYVLSVNSDATAEIVGSYATYTTPSLSVGDFTGSGRMDLALISGPDSVVVLLDNDDGILTSASQLAIAPQGTPLVVDVTGDGVDDVLVVDGAGEILYRQGIPGDPGTFAPPVTINPALPDGSNPYGSRDIAWLPDTDQGQVLASVDVQDNAITFYAFRDGGFVRLDGSLATGGFPAQIIAADLSGDGVTDLVVRNADDGTLSVYFGGRLLGPISPLDRPTFQSAVTLPVGLGVSDVQAIDTTGSGVYDLVFTNNLSGQVSILRNLGDDTFAPATPYRAGAGISQIDPDSTPEITSFDATAGVAAGPLTPGGSTDLVTINPGSNTIDVLDALGGGRFANPVSIETQSPGEVVRMGDFAGNGLEDLAVLTADGVTVYLADGKGGFLAPTTYAVGPESSGLAVADLTGNGKLDLLVGDAYGDVLVLLGNGDGTFQPYHEASQSIELAVADLTGNGARDIIFADQGLDRVVVDYGIGESRVLANQASGLLDPGAVALADLNDDGIPDLIVANSGSNNVLIYPGLGNGQFGPAVNDGNGYFVGTDPVGITVASLTGSLPDLVVADEGSNQVSILDNQSAPGGAISFSAGPRLNSGGTGPVSTVVGNFGGNYPDLLVTNSQSNNVALLKGLGEGFFDDNNPSNYTVGADPGPTFVANFNGQSDLLTVNAGSNNLTLVTDFLGPDPTTTVIASGGIDPDSAFAFSVGADEEDLVVGNAGDGVFSLFEGGPDGLAMLSATAEPNVPDPTDLAFSTLTGGQVQFFAATAGRESAALLALSLGIANAPISPAVEFAPPAEMVQLISLHEAGLPLVATLLTLTITVSSAEELQIVDGESDVSAVAAFLPGSAVSVGQGLLSPARGGPVGPADPESDTSEATQAVVPAATAPWERFVLGLDEAIEKFQRENFNGAGQAPIRDAAGRQPEPPAGSPPPAQGGSTSSSPSLKRGNRGSEPEMTEAAIDAVIQLVWGHEQSQKGVGALQKGVAKLLGDERVDHPAWPWVAKNVPDAFVKCDPFVRCPRLQSPVLRSLVVTALASHWVHAHWRHQSVRTGRCGKVGKPGSRPRAVIL
jgi:hypothetical protein